MHLNVSDGKLEKNGSNTEFIVLDAQPMSVVEDKGFRRLLEYFKPRHSLPSRKYFFKTGIQFIINSTTVSDLCLVSTDTQSPGIGVKLKKSDWCIPSDDFSKTWAVNSS